MQLLTTQDLLQTRPLSEYLSQLNARRQRIEEEMLQRVLPTINPTDPALVIHDPEGHAGVMGIVASRVLERFFKPVYIIAEGKGSVRSTPGISAVGGLRFAEAHLKRYGGHAQAAGFAIKDSEIPAFARAIHRYAGQFPAPVPEIALDGWLEGEDLRELHQSLQLLEPYGEGNAQPMFLARGKPEFVRTLSEGKHLSFRLNGHKVIKWRDNGENLPQGLLDAAVGLEINEWQGEQNVEMRAAVYRPSQELGAAWALPVGLQEALRAVQSGPAKVYVAAGGAHWFTSRGIEVVDAAQAEYWFSLPEEKVVAHNVRVALSEKALAALENHPDPLKAQLGRRVARAYTSSSALFCTELERLWQLDGALTL